MSRSFAIALSCILVACVVGIFYVLFMQPATPVRLQQTGLSIAVAVEIHETWPDADVLSIDDLKMKITALANKRQYEVLWNNQARVGRSHATIAVPSGTDVAKVLLLRATSDKAIIVTRRGLEEVDAKATSEQIERGELTVLGYVRAP